MHGIILAGGKATRLGPLAAQLNKSLVTVGNKPMLVRQVQQLKKLGCDTVCVVVSPGAQDQVQSVIERAGLPGVTTTVQPQALGPAEAVQCGLGSVLEGAVVVMTADTVLSDSDIVMSGDACAAATPPTKRPWCVWNTAGFWEDKVVGPDFHWQVAVGLYRFSDAASLFMACHMLEPGYAGEYQLSDLMNKYRELGGRALSPHAVFSWQDVGDVPALARANRAHFLSRDFNGLKMEDDGSVTKASYDPAIDSEIRFFRNLPREAEPLFPHVYESTISGQEAEPSSYRMDFVDSPSLSELWLYWPSVPEMWEHVGCELRATLASRLWPLQGDDALTWENESYERSALMWETKLRRRYEKWPAFLPRESHIRVWQDGYSFRDLIAGRPLISRLSNTLHRTLVSSSLKYGGVVHGDPTFQNVLWSLKTGSFKLLDPRGDWGGQGPVGDIRYDIGKIITSPVMAPVMHDLFTVEERWPKDKSMHEGEWKDWRFFDFNIWTQRNDSSVPALEKPFMDVGHGLLLKAYMCLSSAPLHNERQGLALYLSGLMFANAALRC